MRNLRKKILCLLLAAGAAAAAVLPAAGADSQTKATDPAAAPAVVRAVPCAACGKGRVSSRIVFLSDWGSTGNPRPCDYFPEGEDMLESRQGISNYRCPACGESYNTYFVEYRWACHGFK